MLTWDQFRDGVALVAAAFPKLDPPPDTVKAWYALLKDLNPDGYRQAIVAICQTVTELYPGTNLIALIRHRAMDKVSYTTANPEWLKRYKARVNGPVPIAGVVKGITDRAAPPGLQAQEKPVNNQ